MDALIQNNYISVQFKKNILHCTILTVYNIKYQNITSILHFRCSFGASAGWPYFPFWLEQRVLHAHGGRCMCLASKYKNLDYVLFPLCKTVPKCKFSICHFNILCCIRLPVAQEIFSLTANLLVLNFSSNFNDKCRSVLMHFNF